MRRHLDDFVKNALPDLLDCFAGSLRKASYNRAILRAAAELVPLDWASRPYGDNSCDDKPLAIMGASIGAIATVVWTKRLKQK